MGQCLPCRAAREIGRWARHGFPVAAKADRIRICRACTFFDGHRCSQCGCLIIAKALLATSSCPLGKWPGDPPSAP